MTFAQLQDLADELGMNGYTAHTSQTRLIRAVQVIRGSEPCFSTEKRYKCVEDCEWSQNCRKLRAEWLR